MPLKHSVEELILKNGARGLLINTPSSTSVFYDIHFWAGVRFVEDPGRSQAAHVMEHLSFGANSQYSTAEAFSQEFSKNGAYHNAFTSNIDMSYYVGAAHMEWERILNLHLLAITEPRYTKKGLEAEKGNVREEIIGYASNNSRVLWQEVMKSAGLHRWYDPDELKTVDAIDMSDITAHFARTHTTSNMKFVVAGNLKASKDTIIEKLESMALPRGKELEIPRETAAPQGPVFITRKDVPNLTFSLTFFLNRELTRDELRTMSVLCHVLTDTFHSRIFGEARQRGICYGMGSGYESSPTRVTDFSISGQVSIENAAELFALIMKELKDVRDNSITESELQQAKDYRLGSLELSNETVRSLAGWYAEEYYENNRIDALDDMPMRIAKTSTEDIRILVEEFFSTNLWTLGGIGNMSADQFNEHYNFVREHMNEKVQ